MKRKRKTGYLKDLQLGIDGEVLDPHTAKELYWSGREHEEQQHEEAIALMSNITHQYT